ncbi:MAG TPA: type III secretion inner membrane ring lipoprotein SctJ [Rhodocyclaceae bacterium]|nr:type III secretion inner membrane ring lipoprotein SctJ [Rhodocyclaceae bacterium]
MRAQYSLHGRFHAIVRCLVIGAIVLLTACKEEVYTHLSERDVNAMMLTLLKGGVSADKRLGADNSFSLMVDESQIALAIEVLAANGQPQETYASMKDIFSGNAMVATPTEERVRYLYGMEQSLAKTLSQIDGVLVARVHVVVPANDPLAVAQKPASTSVFLKYRADMNMQTVVPAVKDLVVRSVEGLTPDNVSVTLFPSMVTSAVPAQVPVTRFLGTLVSASSLPSLRWMVFAPWVAVAILLVLLARATAIRQWWQVRAGLRDEAGGGRFAARRPSRSPSNVVAPVTPFGGQPGGLSPQPPRPVPSSRANG